MGELLASVAATSENPSIVKNNESSDKASMTIVEEDEDDNTKIRNDKKPNN